MIFEWPAKTRATLVALVNADLTTITWSLSALHVSCYEARMFFLTRQSYA